MDSDKLHSGIISVRNTEAVLGWTRNTFYSAINIAMLGLLLLHLAMGTFSYFMLCVGGIVLMVSWQSSAKRTRALMTYWNEKLGELESADKVLGSVRVFSGDEFKTIDGARTRGHETLIFLIRLFGALWIGLGIYSCVFRLINTPSVF